MSTARRASTDAGHVPDPRLRRARLATSAVFLLTGFLFASWAARIPALKAQLGLGDGQLALGLRARPKRRRGGTCPGRGLPQISRGPANGRDARQFGGALRRGDGWLMPPIPLDRLGPLGTLGAGVDLAHVHPFAAMLGVRRASRALRSSTGVRRTGHPTSHSRLSTPTGRWAKMSAFVACDRSSDRHRRHKWPHRSREHRRQTSNGPDAADRNRGHDQARILLPSAARRAA